MTVAVITTVRHNIGDDFVREGITYLLELTRKNAREDEIEFALIHKHAPVTTVYGAEAIRSLRPSRILEPAARMIGLPDRIGEADLVLQSGAPVYWCHPGRSHCADNEWFDPLIRKRFLPNRRGRKLLNLAGGSCQRYHSDGSEVCECEKCRNYIAEFFDTCDLTTLRDDLARTMLKFAGRDAPVLPCTSIFARDRLGISPQDGEYIVLNFMERGGHFTFGQDVDAGGWREKFRAIATLAGKMGKVVVSCHNEKEYELAAEVVPGVDRFLVPDDHVEFVRFYARARFGIVNRVHAAFMLASLGKPAAVIGLDSRALMVEKMGLPSYYVGDVGAVEPIVEGIAAQERSYGEVSAGIRDAARRAYVDLLSAVI